MERHANQVTQAKQILQSLHAERKRNNQRETALEEWPAGDNGRDVLCIALKSSAGVLLR